MNAVIIIAAHHLKRVARSPGLILLLLAVPVTLAVIMYAAFGRTAGTGRLPAITVLFLDEDRTFVSSAVPQLFGGGPFADQFTVATAVDRDEARRSFERGTASALIVAPAGLQQAVLSGARAELVLYRNPRQTISPQVVESVLDMIVVVANGLLAEFQEPLAEIDRFSEAGREPSEDEILELSRSFYRAGQRLSRVGALEGLTVEVERPEGDDGGSALQAFGSDRGRFFAYMFPGLALFAVFFISQALMVRLLRDRTEGLHRRLLTLPVGRAAIVGGALLYMLAGLLVTHVALGALGVLVFGIQLRDPVWLLLFGAVFSVFAASLQLVIAGLSDTERGAQAISGVAILVLALLGGTFVPADNFPPFLRALAHLLPNGATQQGLVDVLVWSRPPEALLRHLVIAGAWAGGALIVALAVERRGIRPA
jgi:hypothetical protein